MSIIPPMFIKPFSSIKKCILVLAVLGLASCTQVKTATTPTHVGVKDIIPYQTSTPEIRSPTPQIATPVPRTPDPTPTPFSHTVEKGETMLGIAIQYGIDLEDLQAANSGVDPNMLSVGTQLIIPIGDEGQGSVISPTPVPISLRSPDCYPTADEAVWCFVLVENRYPFALENVSAWVGLFSGGNNYMNGTAFSPLNRIGSNEKVPLMVFFSAPILSEFSAKTELITALDVSGDSERYLDVEIEIDEVDIDSDGIAASVRGQVIFPAGPRYPRVVWLAVVAYGEDGAVVGVRKWEVTFPQYDEPVATDQPEDTITPPAPLQPLPFDIDVYSLGPAIEHVDVLIEAQP